MGYAFALFVHDMLQTILTLLVVLPPEAIGERGGESGEIQQLPWPSWLQPVCSSWWYHVRASRFWSPRRSSRCQRWSGCQRCVRHHVPLADLWLRHTIFSTFLSFPVPAAMLASA